MARINLLPWREEERTRKLHEFMFMLGAGAVVAMLISFYVHVYMEGLIDQQNTRNSFINAEIKKLDDQIKAIQELEKQKDSLLARMKIIQELQESRPEIVHLFDEMVNAVPDGLYLTKLSQVGRILTVEGRAQSNARVSAFMRNIDASAWMGNSVLQIIEQKAEKSTASKKATDKTSDEYSRFVLTALQIDKRKKQDDDAADIISAPSKAKKPEPKKPGTPNKPSGAAAKPDATKK